MNSITLDFTNHIVCIMSQGQQGTEFNPGLRKELFKSFIPERYLEHDSFTWNFENETFVVNQGYSAQVGSIITSDHFIPRLIVPMNGLKKRYKEFLSLMDYEEINIKDELPADLKRILGLD